MPTPCTASWSKMAVPWPGCRWCTYGPGACDEVAAEAPVRISMPRRLRRECAADHRLHATFDRKCGGGAGDLDVVERDVLGLARDPPVERDAAQVHIGRRARPGGRAEAEHAKPIRPRRCRRGGRRRRWAARLSKWSRCRLRSWSRREHDGSAEHIRRCAGRHVDQSGPTLRAVIAAAKAAWSR